MKQAMVAIAVIILIAASCSSGTYLTPYTPSTTSPSTSAPLLTTSTQPTTASQPKTSITTTTSPTTAAVLGMSRSNPLPRGQPLITDGIQITVVNATMGSQAWSIIQAANMFNTAPAPGMQYVIITVQVKNISSSTEPYTVMDSDFSLVGSSSVQFRTYDQSAVLPDSGDLSELFTSLFHDGQKTGSIHFYIPQTETNLVLISDLGFSLTGSNLRYLSVT